MICQGRDKCVSAVLQGAAVSTATCVQLHKRAEKIAAALTEKGSINTGENVVLLYPPSESCCCLFLLRVLIFHTFLFTPTLPAVSFTGIDLIAAFYGCLYAGCVPVNVRPPHPQNLAATLPTVRMIIDVCLSALLQMHAHYFGLMDFVFQVSKAACILTTQHLMRILRSKEAAASVNIKTWPTIIDTGVCVSQYSN